MKKNIDPLVSEYNISQFHLPRWEELPGIDLYMDQVLTYIDTHLSCYLPIEKEDKLITKTMINNYVKQKLIEPPINKKYQKIQIAKLFVICILKQVYSIPDIKELIELGLSTSSLCNSYNKFCEILEKAIHSTFFVPSILSTTSLSSNELILQNVVQSFANKLYVQIIYLKKDKS